MDEAKAKEMTERLRDAIKQAREDRFHGQRMRHDYLWHSKSALMDGSSNVAGQKQFHQSRSDARIRGMTGADKSSVSLRPDTKKRPATRAARRAKVNGRSAGMAGSQKKVNALKKALSPADKQATKINREEARKQAVQRKAEGQADINRRNQNAVRQAVSKLKSGGRSM